MKIGIISPYALPEKGAASMRIESFLNYFKNQGHKTTIYAPLRKDIQKKERAEVKRYSKIRELWKGLKKEDFLIITSPPIQTAFLIIPLLRLKQIPFLFDSRDLAAVNNKKFKNLKTFMEKYCVKLSNKISTATEYSKEYYIKNYKISQKKIKTIPNGVDRSVIYFVRGARKKIRRELNIPEKAKTIVYTGILGKNHDIEGFINSLDKQFMDKNNLFIVMILIVGDTENKSVIRLKKIEKTIEKKELVNKFRIIKNISPEKIKEYLSAFDIGITPMLSNKDNLYTLPVKTYEYLSCNLGVIGVGAKNGEIDKFLKRSDFGFFIHKWQNFKPQLQKFLKKKDKIKIPLKLLESIDRKESAKKLLEFIEE